MKKILYILPAALILSGCSLGASKSTPITGTEAQKAEKLAQIISSGGQADCKVLNLEDNSSTQVIISGKKMKFVGSDLGEGKKGTMLSDGAYTYIWSEGEKVGFKSKIETPEPTEESEDNSMIAEPQATDQAEAYNDETKYKTECVKRSISESEFVPPTDVNFTDFAEMMKGVPQN